MQLYPRLKLGFLVSVVLLTIASAMARYLVAAPMANVRASGSNGTDSSPNLITEAAAPPVAGGPGFYSLSAFEFTPEVSYCCVSYEGPDLYNSSSAEVFPYAAPVNLPNGATVTKLILYFWDSSVNDLSASLYRVPLDGNPVEEMVETFSAGSPGYGSSASTLVDFPVIDQQAYAYYVEVPLPQGSDVRLRGVRIDYGYSASLPLVTKQD